MGERSRPRAGPRSEAARRRHQGPSMPRVPSTPSRQAPTRRTCGPSACHIPVRFTQNSPTNTRPNSPPYHCPASPLTRGPPPFPPISHSQIDGCCQAAHPTLDGRHQAAHPTREESVLAGSTQVPPMATCGIDGIERPLHPSQSERAFDSDMNIQIRIKCTCSLRASKAVVQNRINCTHLGKPFPVRGVRGTSSTRAATAQPGKPFQCDATGAASSSVRSPRNRKTIPE